MKLGFGILVIGWVLVGAGRLWAQGTSTPTATPEPVLSYANSDTAVALAIGCTVQVVDQVRQLDLDITTSYILMRLCTLTGVDLQDLLQMRLTMGWDEICSKFRLDWSSFSVDLESRAQTLQPEMITPDQVLRGAANDPTQFPDQYPSPMPDQLTFHAPVTEICSSCH